MGSIYVKNEARPPKIWAIVDADPQASVEAQKRCGALEKARGGEGLEPSIVAEVVAMFRARDKVNRKDLLAAIKTLGVLGRQVPRYAESAIRELSAMDIQVWR